jgi:1,4-dihydroxy-2-naphthoate octaprenyltransferase
MHPAFRSLPRRFLYAVKPASWPKLLVPAAVGQALGALSSGTWSWGGAAIGAAFTTALLVHVVLLNDWFDVRVDAIKRQMFPDAGAPKTIPDAILHPQTVLLAGLGAGLCAASLALCGELLVERPGLALAGLGCIGLLLAYSAPPLRFNDRGVGELLEAVGVGALLPWFNAYAQSGELLPAGLIMVLPGLVMLALASAIASGLADEESDLAGGKSTFTTQFGNPEARRAAEYSLLGGALCWAIVARLAPQVLHPFSVTAGLGAIAWHMRTVMSTSPRATTNAFAEISRYKQALHRAVWDGSLALTGTAVLLWLLGVGW